MKLLIVHTPSHRVLRDRYFLPSLRDDFELCQYEYVQEGNGEFMAEDWSRAILFKCDRILDTIRGNPGEVFVYADVDLVFLAPARKHLLRAIRDCDIACQRDDPAGNFCTGFFVARANARTLALWEGVRRAILTEGRDQLAFNRLAQADASLRVHFLSERFFGAGTFSGQRVTMDDAIHIPLAPILFHANWTVGIENKRALLERVAGVVRGGFFAILHNNARHRRAHLKKQRGMTSVDPSPVNAVATTVAPPPTPVATVPSSVCLELSSACQLDCPACPTARGDIARHLGARHLSIDDFRRFLDGHPQVGHVELSNWGELFLNKSLPDILRLAHERGVALSADNGTNLNTVREGDLEMLVKYRLRSLTCSLDGASQAVYSRYRVNGDFEHVIGHIREINRHKERYGSELPRLRWQFVAFGHNQHEIAEAKRLAGELGMEFYLKLSWEDLYTEAFSPISDRDLIRRESGLEAADRDEYERRYGRSYVADTCRQLWDMPRIHADGRLLGCSINYRSDFGNVFEEGLESCLASERMTHARAMVTGRAPPRSDIPCSTCKVYLGMQRTGSWLEPRDFQGQGL